MNYILNMFSIYVGLTKCVYNNVWYNRHPSNEQTHNNSRIIQTLDILLYIYYIGEVFGSAFNL